MSLAEELVIHEKEPYDDLHGEKFAMAVFGAARTALLHEAEIEAVSQRPVAENPSPEFE